MRPLVRVPVWKRISFSESDAGDMVSWVQENSRRVQRGRIMVWSRLFFIILGQSVVLLCHCSLTQSLVPASKVMRSEQMVKVRVWLYPETKRVKAWFRGMR